MPQHIKWIFFDVGSTLLDEHFAYEHRFQQIAESANTTYEQIYEKAISFYKNNQKGDLKVAEQLGVAIPKWDSSYEILYPQTKQCLASLHQKYKIGIIANQLPGTKDRLAQHGILQYIDLVIASAEEGVAKPDLRIFEIALEKSGCLPSDSVMVGDRIDNDIIPAKKIGMYTVWIKQGFGQYWNIHHPEEQPDFIIHDLSELEKLF